jgi:hypothetical protein
MQGKKEASPDVEIANVPETPKYHNTHSSGKEGTFLINILSRLVSPWK